MNALHEQYRPTSFADVVGQPKAVRHVQAVIARGWGGRGWWITGASGTGKSTLAQIIAKHGADDFNIEELDAGALTPAKLRDIELEMRCRAIGTLTGRAYLVNESHGLRKDTIRLLLVLLERLPPHVVWIFTTTRDGQDRLFETDDCGDAAPLLSRCTEIVLENDDAAQVAFARRARQIAVTEGIDGVPESVYVLAARKARGNMRSLLQRIESGAFRDDARQALERDLSFIRSTKGPDAERRRNELTAAIAALA